VLQTCRNTEYDERPLERFIYEKYDSPADGRCLRSALSTYVSVENTSTRERRWRIEPAAKNSYSRVQDGRARKTSARVYRRRGHFDCPLTERENVAPVVGHTNRFKGVGFEIGDGKNGKLVRFGGRFVSTGGGETPSESVCIVPGQSSNDLS